MSMYRLVAERAGAGPHEFPRVFATIEDACAFGERNLDRLAAHHGWRVRGFRVVELPGLRVVTNVVWHDPEYDPDPFSPGAVAGPGGTGSVGAHPSVLPSDEAPAEP